MSEGADAPLRVAVVGAGIAGLSTAYHLAKYGGGNVRVSLLEQEDVLGGHEMPLATKYGTVDLGYMVFNAETYPNLLRFYQEHHIPIEPTDMSFAVETPSLSWRFGGALSDYLRLLTKPEFHSFLRDKHRFHHEARQFLKQHTNTDTPPPALTLGEFCAQQGYDTPFAEGWLRPFCEAVWSAKRTAAFDMEAWTILQFLRNHGFLSWSSPQWYTPKGRTTVTLERFAMLLEQHSVQVQTATRVTKVQRRPDGRLDLTTQNEHNSTTPITTTYDKVVLATPAGVAQHLLAELDERDAAILGAFATSRTQLCVHRNRQLMPKNTHHWASWNVLDREDKAAAPVLTYWLKPLQHVAEHDLFITLNPPNKAFAGPAQELLLESRSVVHPIMGIAAAEAQRHVWSSYQGHRGIYLAGAYLHYGFHEDGFRSGIEVARCLLNSKAIPLLPVVDHFAPTSVLMTGVTNHTRYFKPPGMALFLPADTFCQFDASGKVVHAFSYQLEYDCVDIDAGFSKWWGGLCRADHFGDSERSLSEVVRNEVCRQTGEWPTGPISLVTLLRRFGFCFNPISIFLCWADDARTSVTHLVVEVTNTPWKERTVLVIPTRGERTASNIKLPKSLHVSPFNTVPDGRAHWRFAYSLPANGNMSSFFFKVDLLPTATATQPIVTASMKLAATTRSRRWFPSALWTSLLIHWEAALLRVVRGMAFYDNTGRVTATRQASPASPLRWLFVACLVGLILQFFAF
ncbi:uncharacterized protein MONBRDRAFT_30477 [Monosiga brevicollis MX1]|uniref:Amine oxidase domain-containing protein n=1 Tax=Monosiga brevicollis TaxID=81824 RepID=A9VE25_MONBE|nr:uncharacterized protein MONBRDRAFT_30477 [Monosiga brevicollis MX1]EDQ84235.1 predicted protein [Monosiga brevicollis MX1]|eukprot:XP_001750959.1 hypothetical protein [Monosiga brevicollis MX1]